MAYRSLLFRACILGLFAIGGGCIATSGCTVVEKINPAPFDGGMDGSTAASSSSGGESGSSSGGGNGGAAGQGGMGGGGMGGAAGQGGMAGGGMGGTAGQGGMAGSGGAGGSAATDAGPSDASFLCPITTMSVAIEASPHVAACSVVTYSTNPPTSGPHYPSWAAFKWYESPVPWGFIVHSMEHGAVVITYNCPNGCADDLATLAAFLDARPADPLCTAPLKARIIVMPDPNIDSTFAATAWGAFMKSDCLDTNALGIFLDEHYAKAPENLCFNGADVLSPDAGTPVDCGMPTDAGSDGG